MLQISATIYWFLDPYRTPAQKDDMCLGVHACAFASRVYMQFNTLKKITKTKREEMKMKKQCEKQAQYELTHTQEIKCCIFTVMLFLHTLSLTQGNLAATCSVV